MARLSSTDQRMTHLIVACTTGAAVEGAGCFLPHTKVRQCSYRWRRPCAAPIGPGRTGFQTQLIGR